MRLIKYYKAKHEKKFYIAKYANKYYIAKYAKMLIIVVIFGALFAFGGYFLKKDNCNMRAFECGEFFFDKQRVCVAEAFSECERCGRILGGEERIVYYAEGTPLLEPSDEEMTDELLSRFENMLPEEYRGISKDEERLDSLVGPEAVLREIFLALSDASGGIGAFFGVLLGCIALSALCEVSESRLSESAGVGVTIVFGASVLALIVPIFREIAESLRGAADFFEKFVPIATAVQVSSGSVNSASVSAAGMNITVSVLSGIIVPALLSVAGFGLSVGIISSFGGSPASPLASGIKRFFMWVMGLISALMMGALSLQTYIASARDSAAMRAARYAATSMIPVVGGTVSGALATLATGMSYVKGVIGVGALAVLLSMLLSPFVILILYRGAVSLAAGLAGYLGVGRAENLLTSLRGAFDIYLALYSIFSVLFLFEIVLFMMGGGE